MAGNPLTYAFWAGEGPQDLTYEQLKRRQAVAAALAGQKRPFPKTLGEGMTALGESIGERLNENRLLAAEASHSKAAAAEKARLTPGLTPGGLTPGAAVPPSIPPRVGANFGLGGGPAPPAAPGPVAAADEGVDPLDRIAALLVDQEGGAPANPPLAAGPSVVQSGLSRQYAALPPTTMSDAANEVTPTDIRPAPPTRVAGPSVPPDVLTPPVGAPGVPAAAPGPAPAISGPLTPARPGAPPQAVEPLPAEVAPRPVDPRFTRASSIPKPPSLPPITPYETRAYELMQNPRFQGDPGMADYAQKLLTYGQGLRKAQYDRDVEVYKGELARYEKEALAEQEYSRNYPKLQQDIAAQRQTMQGTQLENQKKAAEIAQQQSSQRVSEQLGGLTPQQYIADVIKPSAAEVKNLPAAAATVATAKEMIGKGIFHGASANLELSKARLFAAVLGASDPRIANTQTFQTSMVPLIASMRQAIAGNANISDKDVALAERMAGGDITLDRRTIERVLETAERANVFNAVQHQKKLARFGGGDPNRIDAAYTPFGLPMERLVPPSAVERLRRSVEAARGDPAKVQAELLEFNQDFATPGLAEKLLTRR